MGKFVSVDIETLGTVPGNIILSIGAVKFDERGLLALPSGDMDEQQRHKAQTEFYREISVGSAGSIGLTFSNATMAWWMEQSAEAQATLKRALAGEADDIRQVFGDLHAWLTTGLGCDELWGWGQFDAPMLRYTFDRMGVTKPWDYHIERDGRTFCADLPIPRPDPEGVHHNALDDAKWQAKYVAAGKRWMKKAVEGVRMMEHMEFANALSNQGATNVPVRDQYGHPITETQDAQVEVVHNESAAQPAAKANRSKRSKR